jgi:hypothetical protein
MSITIHATVLDRVLTHGRIYDGRIKHLPAALRRCKQDGYDLRKEIKEILNPWSGCMDKTGINATTGRRVWRRSTLASLRKACKAVHRKFGLRGAELMHRVWSCYAICGGHIPQWAGVPMTRLDHNDEYQREIARTVSESVGWKNADGTWLEV